MLQTEENREIVLADMHDDGVHFDPRKLAKLKVKRKKVKRKKAKRKNEKLKSKQKRN